MRGAATVASLRCNSPARLLLLPVEAGYWQPACGAIGASKRVGDFSRQLEGGEHFGGRAFCESFVAPFLTEPLTDLGSRLKAQGWLPARARRFGSACRPESGNTLHALQLFRFLAVSSLCSEATRGASEGRVDIPPLCSPVLVHSPPDRWLAPKAAPPSECEIRARSERRQEWKGICLASRSIRLS